MSEEQPAVDRIEGEEYREQNLAKLGVVIVDQVALEGLNSPKFEVGVFGPFLAETMAMRVRGFWWGSRMGVVKHTTPASWFDHLIAELHAAVHVPETDDDEGEDQPEPPALPPEVAEQIRAQLREAVSVRKGADAALAALRKQPDEVKLAIGRDLLAELGKPHYEIRRTDVRALFPGYKPPPEVDEAKTAVVLSVEGTTTLIDETARASALRIAQALYGVLTGSAKRLWLDEANGQWVRATSDASGGARHAQVSVTAHDGERFTISVWRERNDDYE